VDELARRTESAVRLPGNIDVAPFRQLRAVTHIQLSLAGVRSSYDAHIASLYSQLAS
jgi:predicted component of type VI protein secretion system